MPHKELAEADAVIMISVWGKNGKATVFADKRGFPHGRRCLCGKGSSKICSKIRKGSVGDAVRAGITGASGVA